MSMHQLDRIAENIRLSVVVWSMKERTGDLVYSNVSLIETFKLLDSTNNTLKTIPYASGSIGINSLFTLCFVLYVLVFISLLASIHLKQACSKDDEKNKQLSNEKKKSQPQNRNQRIMLSLVWFLVSIQLLALVARIVADSLAIIIRQDFGTLYNDITNGKSVPESDLESFFAKMTCFHVFVAADFGLTKGNVITMVVVMNFIQNVL